LTFACASAHRFTPYNAGKSLFGRKNLADRLRTALNKNQDE
jgi:hypothetical protein